MEKHPISMKLLWMQRFRGRTIYAAVRKDDDEEEIGTDKNNPPANSVEPEVEILTDQVSSSNGTRVCE